MAKKSDRTIIGKGMSLKRGEASRLEKKPGMSNVGKYKNVAKKDFAGPKGTFPINDLSHARSALKLSHNAANPDSIRRKVFSKYPQLKIVSMFSSGGKKKK